MNNVDDLSAFRALPFFLRYVRNRHARDTPSPRVLLFRDFGCAGTLGVCMMSLSQSQQSHWHDLFCDGNELNDMLGFCWCHWSGLRPALGLFGMAASLVIGYVRHILVSGFIGPNLERTGRLVDLLPQPRMPMCAGMEMDTKHTHIDLSFLVSLHNIL